MSTTRSLPARYHEGCIKTLDQRTELSRRLNKIFNEIVDDLGGADALSYISLSLVERYVWLEFTLREFERRLGESQKGSEKILSRWIQGLNSLQGLAKTLGIKRKPPTIDLELQRILKKHRA